MDKRGLIFVAAMTAAFFIINHWFFPKEAPPQTPPAQEQIVQPKVAATETPQLTQGEQFFVLENAYQQLVFSTVGGALAEINLPLHSKEHPKSPILPIEIDRILEKTAPENDLFPAFPYTIADPTPRKVEERKLNSYYPLIRRGFDGKSVNPRYYATNLVSEDPQFAHLVFDLKRLEPTLIEFEARDSQRKITKTYSFASNPDQAPYCFDLTIKIEGDAKGIWMTSGVPEVEMISGSSTPSLKYRITRNQKATVEQIDLPKTSSSFSAIHPDWVCNSNGFFGIIIDPLNEIGAGFNAICIPGLYDPSRLMLIDPQHDLYPAEKFPGYEIHMPLRGAQTYQFRLFAGPFVTDILKTIDAAYSDPSKGYNPDYVACQSFHGWFAFISEPFAKFLFFLMKGFYLVTHSWGISIILLTVALRLMLYPLNAWSIRSSLRMQQIAPQVTALQERFKKDPKRAQMEIMNLYREKGVNPLTGCLPLLIQMPFLIGMFDLLKSTFELRGAGLIPGWITNLAAPDVVFSWNYPIIFFGTSFHLLPILLGLVMFIQQRFASPLPKDVNLLTDQQRQQRFMGNIMTIVFAVMFYHFPSGLNLYWLSSMLLGILQQWYMTKKQGPKSGESVGKVR